MLTKEEKQAKRKTYPSYGKVYGDRKTYPSYGKVYGDRRVADKKYNQTKRVTIYRSSPFMAWEYAYGDENGNGPWNDDKDEDEDNEVSIIPCQNCDAPLTLEQARHGALFCGEKCQQTAKAVRYARATLRDGRYQRDPLVYEAVELKIAFVLGGGYPEKARRLSPAQREAIFVRDDRRCRLCGAPATTIDHIASSSSDPANLRALCEPCNRGRVQLRPAPPEEQAEGEAIWVRIEATQPHRRCDDEKQWNELRKEIAAEYRRRAREIGNP